MRRAAGSAGRLAALGVAVAAVTMGGTSCAGTPRVACAGQCGPPYVLMVHFAPGTNPADADKAITACTSSSPVVIGIGALRGLRSPAGPEGLIYTKVMGVTGRVGALLTCLRSSSLIRGNAGFGG